MPFGDFDVNKLDGDGFALIDTVSPINGAGSLRLAGSMDTNPETMSITLNSSQSRGYNAGRIQTLFRRESPAASGLTRGSGLLFVCSSATPWLVGQSCYFAGLSQAGAGNMEWRIFKFTNGFTVLSDGVELGNSTTNVPAITQTRAIEVEWNDAPEFGGTRIIFRAAPDNVFGNMVDVITFTDTTPNTTLLTEGFLSIDSAGSVTNFEDARFDDTSFF